MSSKVLPDGHQVQVPKSITYLALGLFALGLMSKPMLVTLPFALLLLDFWPLKRSPGFKVPSSKPESPEVSVSWVRLVVEKLPFFALAAAACMVTYQTQQHAGAVSSLEEVTLPRRLGNAAVAYLRYAGKTAWPSGLAAFYPYPRHQSLILILAGVGFVVIMSGLALVAARRRPFLFTGWFWFLGTLVPTIGLVQVGSQAMADRYMYIPSIGLFVMLVWGLCDFLSACTGESRPGAGDVRRSGGAGLLRRIHDLANRDVARQRTALSKRDCGDEE